MGIFSEYGGRGSYYTADELDRLQNPEKYDYTQETYDAFYAQAQKKADSRAKAEEAAMDAIPYSYVGRGAGSTNPAFSFSGFSGHTSGGTAGLAGFMEGGAVPPVQYMQEGGVIYSTMPVGNMKAELPFKPELITKPLPTISGPMPAPTSVTGVPDTPAQPKPIGTPFADPIKPTMQAMPVARSGPIMSGPMPPPPDMGTGVVGPVAPSPGIGGVFEAQFDQAGPLSSYQSYLMQTYGAPAMDNAQQFIQDDVNYFVDLVNQAERAHFGQGSAQPQAQTPMDRGIASLPAAF